MQNTGLVRAEMIQAGVLQSERFKDLLPHDFDVGLVPQCLDQETKSEVVRVRVPERPDTGRGPREGPGCLKAPLHRQRPGENRTEVNIARQRIVDLGHPGCVAEQLPHSDWTRRLERGREPGNDIIDRVVKADESVVYELQHRHRRHGLGHAGDLHPVGRLRRGHGFEVAHAVCLGPLALRPPDVDDGGDRALIDEYLDLTLQWCQGIR
ncbi:hypothetical protein D9M72_471870 [compost metagenome]